MNSLNPTKPIQLMKPEGSLKIVVLNGSRQVDQVIRGDWMTLKVLPENGLPRGVFQLSDANKPDLAKDGKPKDYEGQLLHVDSKAVFQLCDRQIIKHDRAAFQSLETNDRPLTVGRLYGISYLNGRPNSGSELTAKSAQKPQEAAKATKSVNRGHSI